MASPSLKYVHGITGQKVKHWIDHHRHWQDMANIKARRSMGGRHHCQRDEQCWQAWRWTEWRIREEGYQQAQVGLELCRRHTEPVNYSISINIMIEDIGYEPRRRKYWCNLC
jgi:hypothetical protein